MKICPICDTTFDEEIIRFCTKDGSPLVDNEEPAFLEMPSEDLQETDDDIGEITVIRRKEIPSPAPPIDEPEPRRSSEPPQRIVISTTETPAAQTVRPRASQAYYPPVEKPNTLKVVVLTIIGTVSLLGLGALLFWFLQKDQSVGNVNVNTNLGNFNGNLNANNTIDTNFNFNTVANFDTNLNTNFNSNIRTPTPTPKPTPSVTPTIEPTQTPAAATPLPTPRSNTNARPANTGGPTPAATPRTGPRPNTNSQ